METTTTQTTNATREIIIYAFIENHTGNVLSAVFASQRGWQQMMARRRAYYKGRDVRVERRVKVV